MPSSSSSPQTQQQRAAAAAAAQVTRYERMLDDLALNPALPLDRLYTVATQPEVTDDVAYLNRFRAEGHRQVGRARLLAATVNDVKLGGTGDDVPTARVTACIYVGAVRAYDRKGRSIVLPSRKPYYLTRISLVNFHYPNGPWLVSHVTATQMTSCPR